MTLLGGLTEAVSAQTLSPPSVTVLSGDRSIRISWSGPSDDGGSPITGYDVWYRPASSPSSSWIEKSFSQGVVGIEIEELIAGQSYQVQVRAKNSMGPGAWSSIASVIPASHLDRIRFVTLTPGNKQINFKWTAPGYRRDVTITGFDTRYRAGADGSWIQRSHASYIKGRMFSGLTNGQSYQFQVRAKDSRGGGPWSDIFSATPGTAPLAPAAPRLESGNKQLLVRSSPPAGNGELTINGYKIRYRRTSTSDSWVEKSAPSYYGYLIGLTLTGLTNGQLYEVQVQARDSRGTGPWSSSARTTPNPTAPAAPALPTLAPGDEQLDVSWNAPADYGSAITDYDVQYKLTSASASGWREWNSGMSTTLSATITGLTNGDSYQVRVRAENSAGAGDWSAAASATPAAQAPSKPDAPTLTVGSTQLKVAWDAPTANGAQITDYDVRYKRTSATTWTEWNDSDTSTAIGTIITGLSNGQSYDVQVRATNSVGDSQWSDSASATPAAAAPAAPTNFAATAGDGEVRLTWDNPGDATITKWQYQQKAGTDSYGAWTDIRSSGASTSSHTVTSLANGTRYAFKLRAVNASGNGAESDEASATPIAVPGKPTGFTASPGDGEVRLTWNDPGDAAITRWQYRSAMSSGESGGWTEIGNSDHETASYTVISLNNDTEYYFQVRAVNSSGAGAASSEVSATPVAAPSKVTVTAVGRDASVLLTWPKSGDATITGWQYRSSASSGQSSGWTEIGNSDHETVSYTVTSLDNDTEYYFQVRAVNSSGAGAASNEVRATPVAAPSKVTVTAAARSESVVLTWAGPSDATIEKWQYRSSTTESGSGGWTDIGSSNEDTVAYTVTGLNNGQIHYFQVRAVNSSGAGVASDEVGATPVAKPAAPTNFAAAAGSGEVTLTWNDPNNTTITRWQYQQKAGSGNYGDWTDILPSVALTSSYTVTNLANGTRYTFKLRAVNASGNGVESDEASATPIAVPGKPTGFTASPGDSEVRLTWDDPGDATITKWQYQQKEGTNSYGDWTDIPSNGPSTSSYTVINLVNGTRYAFKLRTVNPSGPGAESNAVTATPIAAPGMPSGFTASAGDGEVRLTWNDPGDATITRWQYQQKAGAGNYGPWTNISGSSATTASHTAPGLTNGTRYRFKLRALNASGPGTPSSEASATPFAATPEAPPVPANAAPVAGDDGAGGSIAVAAGGSVRLMAADLLANDIDADGDTLRITKVGAVSGGAVALTWDDGNTALASLVYTHDPDAGPDQGSGFAYTVSDGRGGEDSGQVVIAVIPANRPPAFGQGGYRFELAEDLAGPVELGAVTAAAADAGDTVAYAISGGGAGRFALDASSGVLRYIGAGEDYESAPRVHELTVTATGGGRLSATAVVTVTLTDVNEAPVFEQDSHAFELPENRPGPVELGAVTAADPDAGATLAYALTEGDASRFAMDAASGALRYIGPGEDYESAPRVHELTVTASDGGGLSATAAVTVTLTDVNEAPVFAQASYAFELEENRIGPLPLGAVTATVPAAGGALDYAMVAGDTDRFALDAASGMLRYIGPGEDYEGQSGVHELTVSATDNEGRSAAAEVTVTVIDERAATTRARLGRVNEAILPELSRALVSGVMGMLAERIGEARTGRAGQRRAAIAGRSLWSADAGALTELRRGGAWERWGEAPGVEALAGKQALDWKEALRGTSFALSVDGAAGEAAGGPAALMVWGGGDWRALSGGDGESPVEWDGDVLGARLGVDTQLREDLLAGVALSWSRGSFDWTGRGEAGYRELEGSHESWMTSLHPYVGWWPGGGVSLWASLGHGRGTVEIADDEVVGGQSSDAVLNTLAVGGRAPLFSFSMGNTIPGGPVALGLRGEAWLARFEVEDEDPRMAGLTVETRCLRLGLEGAYQHRLDQGGVLTPSLELGLRHDGGDGVSGFGVDFGGGLAWRDAALGVTVAGRARTLVMRRGEVGEWGVSGSVLLDPGAAGLGLALQVRPSWGAEAEGGVERLWEDGQGSAFDRTVANGKPLTAAAGMAMRLDAELGYGLGVLRGRGLATPYGGLSQSEGGSRRWRAGGRLRVGPDLSLNLEGERRERAEGGADHGILLTGTLRW